MSNSSTGFTATSIYYVLIFTLDTPPILELNEIVNLPGHHGTSPGKHLIDIAQSTDQSSMA
jgi:hypothetical protein